MRVRAAAHRWRTGFFALLYVAVLAWTFCGASLSPQRDVREFIAHATHAPPPSPPLPPMPGVSAVRWPELAPHQDTLAAPKASSATQVRPHMSAETKPPWFRFVVAFVDEDRSCVLGREDAETLARFCVGDTVDGGVIEAIAGDHVELESEGRERRVKVAAVPAR